MTVTKVHLDINPFANFSFAGATVAIHVHVHVVNQDTDGFETPSFRFVDVLCGLSFSQATTKGPIEERGTTTVAVGYTRK